MEQKRREGVLHRGGSRRRGGGRVPMHGNPQQRQHCSIQVFNTAGCLNNKQCRGRSISDEKYQNMPGMGDLGDPIARPHHRHGVDGVFKSIRGTVSTRDGSGRELRC